MASRRFEQSIASNKCTYLLIPFILLSPLFSLGKTTGTESVFTHFSFSASPAAASCGPAPAARVKSDSVPVHLPPVHLPASNRTPSPFISPVPVHLPNCQFTTMSEWSAIAWLRSFADRAKTPDPLISLIELPTPLISPMDKSIVPVAVSSSADADLSEQLTIAEKPRNLEDLLQPRVELK